MNRQGQKIFFAFTSVLVMVVFAPSVPAQQYDIRLSKDDKVGDQYRVVATARHAEKTTVFAGNTAVKNRTDEFTTELVSSVKVLETNGSRTATKMSLAIEKCLITKGGETKPLIDPGRTVIAALEGKEKVFKIDDVPVDALTKKALGMIVPLQDTDLTDDDIFGSREKRSVGDSWEVNAALVVKSLKETFNISVSEADVKSRTALDGVVKSGREEYLVINAWLDIDRFSVPLPDGVKIQDGQVKGSFSGQFPVSPRHGRFEESGKLAGWFTAIGPPDPKFQGLTIQGLMEQNINRQIEPRE